MSDNLTIETYKNLYYRPEFKTVCLTLYLLLKKIKKKLT